MNEYYEKFMDLRDHNSHKEEQWFGKRQELVEEYSWAVPTDEAVNYIAEQRPIVEIGAGNGYWASLIEGAGANIFAYDAEAPDETWTQVERGYPQRVSKFSSDYTLFLCWPPYDDRMAIKCLDEFEQVDGRDVIYIGENFGGCTANDAFHQRLMTKYAKINEIELPSYYGIDDNLFHYRRKI